MNENYIDKAYVSPIDKFLYQFDATHEKTASQLKEIKKAQRISTLRDNVMPEDMEGEIWGGF